MATTSNSADNGGQRGGGRGRGRGRGRGFFRGSGNHQSPWEERKNLLRQTAQETLSVLRTITSSSPSLNLSDSTSYRLETLPELSPTKCPGYPPVSIKVISSDSFNAAIDISDPPINTPKDKRVAVLNMASDFKPGGGWLNGSMAQEEALCYRSSLSLSLHQRYYPTSPTTAIYTGEVLIIRSDYASGHSIWNKPANELPIVSVLSVAALRRPAINTVNGQAAFANSSDRELTKAKIRLCLRMAASNGHTKLVLGALGCGAFKNPKEVVAECWKEVFEEPEFKGGWWEEIVFAVLDKSSEGNLEAFEKVLGGLTV